jgi:hypothetical protein
LVSALHETFRDESGKYLILIKVLLVWVSFYVNLMREYTGVYFTCYSDTKESPVISQASVYLPSELKWTTTVKRKLEYSC